MDGANLVNILANEEIIPEFVLDNVDPSQIAEQLNKFLKDRQLGKKQIEDTKNIIKQLGYNCPEKASYCGATKILDLIMNQNSEDQDKNENKKEKDEDEKNNS